MTNAPTPAGMAEDPHVMFEHFIAEAISSSPEPLKKLGEFLTTVLDEHHWATAEGYLLALAALAPVAAEGGEKDKLRIAVEALPRWGIYNGGATEGFVIEAESDGEWVRYADLERAALRTEPTGGGEG